MSLQPDSVNLDHLLSVTLARGTVIIPPSSARHGVVVVNIGERPLELPDGTLLGRFRSALFTESTLHDATVLLVNTPLVDITDCAQHQELLGQLRSRWTRADVLFPQVRELAGQDMYRSAITQLAGTDIKVNFWYAGAGVDCGIHQIHDFYEYHTQLVGLGIMQKFREKSHESLWQEVILAPGITHDLFCTPQQHYPWHQYKAITPCVWLAIEKYGECPPRC
jgi:hypothetical protein